MKDELRALGEPYATAARDGLRGIAAGHRAHVKTRAERRLTGSIDLDSALEADPMHASANRWDYGVGFRTANGGRRCAVWVEVHPASPGEVEVMLRKARWLRTWLDGHPTIKALTAAGAAATETSALYWVPTGRDTVTKGSTSFRKLAASGLVKARRVSLP